MPPILTPDQIKQPLGRLIEEPQVQEQDLGGQADIGAVAAAKIGQSFPVLMPSKDWTNVPYIFTDQRNALFEPDDCVTCAEQGAVMDTYKVTYNSLIDQPSRRWTAIKSGTQPGLGNSFSNVYNSINNDGLVREKDCPSITPTTTQDQFYSLLDPSLPEYFKNYFQVFKVAVPSNDIGSLSQALLYGEIVAAICGRYAWNDKGEIIRTSSENNHAIRIVKVPTPDANYYLMVDSENPNGLVKLAPEYDLNSPFVLFLVKKKLPQFIKVGSSIAYLAQSGQYAGQYIGCGSGDVMLSIWNDYRKNQRVELTEWPSNYQNHSLFIN